MCSCFLFSIFYFLFIEGDSYAQVSKTGTAGAHFLKIGVDPRGIAMGGAFTAVTNDVASLYWNPAGIVVPGKREFGFSDVEWVLDTRNSFVGGIFPITSYSVIGINVLALTMGEEEITTLEKPDGTGYNWSANSIALSLSFARWFTDEFTFGMSVKMLREAIWELSATGFAMDAGILLYPTVFENLKIGISITNFGPDMQYKGATESMFREDWSAGTGDVDVELISRPYPMPLCIKLGIAYDLLESSTSKLIGAVDLAHPKDGPERWHTGLEYGLNDMLFLRSGLVYDPNIWEDVKWDVLTEKEIGEEEEPLAKKLLYGNRICFGVGIKYPVGRYSWTIDYAGEDRGRFGGILHRFGIKWEL